VKVQVENTPSVLTVSWRTHVLKYIKLLDNRQSSNHTKGGAHSPVA
jgi:hypothetical protein